MSELEAIIRQEILTHGSISFARFMELALYCPRIGYYEREDSVLGPTGDFYTSVSVGPVFGELLARQFAEWLDQMPTPPRTILEAGAHDGQLASDILTWLGEFRPDLPVEYWIVEPSERRRAWQESKLDVFAGKVTWFASLEALPPYVSGVIFSNELLDAMPVHILQWRGRWLELRVALKGDVLAWETTELTTDLGQPEVPSGLAAVLPDGFQIETSLAARDWWRTAATKLQRGKLVTIDYGLEQDKLLTPQRQHGTVRAYYHHHVTDGLLVRPGEQDLTAHVNFTDIQRTGEETGLKTEGVVGQSKFLTNIAATVSNWPSERVRQFQTLTHPEHLGRAFRVLVQAK